MKRFKGKWRQKPGTTSARGTGPSGVGWSQVGGSASSRDAIVHGVLVGGRVANEEGSRGTQTPEGVEKIEFRVLSRSRRTRTFGGHRVGES